MHRHRQRLHRPDPRGGDLRDVPKGRLAPRRAVRRAGRSAGEWRALSHRGDRVGERRDHARRARRAGRHDALHGAAPRVAARVAARRRRGRANLDCVSLARSCLGLGDVGAHSRRDRERRRGEWRVPGRARGRADHVRDDGRRSQDARRARAERRCGPAHARALGRQRTRRVDAIGRVHSEEDARAARVGDVDRAALRRGRARRRVDRGHRVERSARVGRRRARRSRALSDRVLDEHVGLRVPRRERRQLREASGRGHRHPLHVHRRRPAVRVLRGDDGECDRARAARLPRLHRGRLSVAAGPGDAPHRHEQGHRISHRRRGRWQGLRRHDTQAARTGAASRAFLEHVPRAPRVSGRQDEQERGRVRRRDGHPGDGFLCGGVRAAHHAVRDAPSPARAVRLLAQCTQ